MTDIVVVENSQTITVASVSTEIIAVPDVSIEVLTVAQQGPAGPQGLPGASGVGGAIQYNFAWGDATPHIVIPSSVDKTIFRVDCVITTAFNGAGTTVKLGDSSNNGRLLDVDQIDLTTPGIYQTNPNVKYGTATNINLYISPAGGNSTGAGFFLIYIEN